MNPPQNAKFQDLTPKKLLKRDIDLLPPSMLVEIDHLVRKPTLLSEVAAYAIEDDLPADLAEQHDHYLTASLSRNRSGHYSEDTLRQEYQGCFF